jgi:heme/copper-type cytochrome/quinol oxidase subunit 4
MHDMAVKLDTQPCVRTLVKLVYFFNMTTHTLHCICIYSFMVCLLLTAFFIVLAFFILNNGFTDVFIQVSIKT